MFTQAQIEHLSTLHFINHIDDNVRIVSSIQLHHSDIVRVELLLNVFHHNEKIIELSFDLHNHPYQEIIDIAKNIRNNEFIMYEVDLALGGEIE